VDRAKGQIVIAINDGYQMAPWSDYLYFCDKKWHDWHKDRLDFQAFKGQKISYEVSEASLQIDVDTSKQGISFNPSLISGGSNSGFQAINIAVLMGATRILLLGYDMKIAKSGAAHWFGDHPDKVRSGYMSWLTNFGIAADQLKDKGIEVINCSPDTALTCFKKESLASALLSAQAPASQSNRLTRSGS